MPYAFVADADTNFRIETLLGGVTYGLGDVGEILQAVSTMGDGGDQAWAAAFGTLAERIERIASEAHRDGHPRSARDAYLRAATYYAAQSDAEVTYADDATILHTFRQHRRCWDAFARLYEPALEHVAVPYEGMHLPGYFLSVDGTKRPTIVIINGSDGALTWAWQVAQAAFDYGYNAFMFDGPGQQSMLFEHHVPFRPDWEAVMTPVVDVLLRRPDVRADALALWGGSQAGYWGARTLAFEKRFAAGILDPGVVDVSTSWFDHLPPELLQCLDSGDKADFDAAMNQWFAAPEAKATWNFRARPYGSFDPFDVFSQMKAYNVTAIAHDITTPLFICSPEGEQFWPGQSEQLAGLVSGPVHVERFTAAEGADLHCEPMARTLVFQRMFDWLADTLEG